MEDESKKSVENDAENLDIFSRNPRITEILELVFNRPRTEKEIENMLLSFWTMYDNPCQEEDILDDVDLKDDELDDLSLGNDSQEAASNQFDILCMYMSDCVFESNSPTLSAVSRSLYCYLKCLNLSDEHRKSIIDGTENDFVNTLRELKNFSSAKGEDILIDALMKCLLDGNFGLSIFLLKFGLVEIPTKVNNRSRKIVEKFVDKFNDILQYTFANEQPEDVNPSIEVNAMLDLLIQSDINFRRSLMTFFVIVVISEFRLHDKIQTDNFKEMMEERFNTKFVCLYELFDEIPEAKIKFNDIETFIVKILSPLLGVDFGNSLVQFSRDVFCELWNTLNSRSLKDLTRSTIRKNLQNSMMFPEQVNQFHIPLKLKDFLLFHREDIFCLLKLSHFSSCMDETIRFVLDEDLHINLEN